MIDNPFKDPGFWERMQENARIVEKMPTWMKGSPVNRRESGGSMDAVWKKEEDEDHRRGLNQMFEDLNLQAIKAEEPTTLRPGLPLAPSNEVLYSAKDRGQIKSLKMHYLYLKDKIESSTRQLFYDERSAAALRWAFSKLSPETLRDLPKFKGFEQQELCEDEGCPNAGMLHECRDLQADWMLERKQRGWSAEAVRFAKQAILESLTDEDPACKVSKGLGYIAATVGQSFYATGNTEAFTNAEWAIALGQMLQDGSVRIEDGLVTKGRAKKRKKR